MPFITTYHWLNSRIGVWMVLPRERSWNRWPPLFLRLQSCSSCHPFLLFRFLLLHLLVHLPPSPHLIFPMCKLAPRTIRASPSCVPELAEHSLEIAMAKFAMTMATCSTPQIPVLLQLLQTHLPGLIYFQIFWPTWKSYVKQNEKRTKAFLILNFTLAFILAPLYGRSSLGPQAFLGPASRIPWPQLRHGNSARKEESASAG